jgi:GntR family transcriptional regulator
MSSEFGKLDHNSFIPLYYQLKEIILEKMETNEWGLNQAIPSEHHLQEIFDVSRATVRRTVELLVNEGFLEKKRGKGTFVKKPRIEEDLPVLKSFTEEMAGRNARKHVITAEYIEPPPKIAEHMVFSPDELVFHLKRLMIVDESPLGILDSYIPARYGLTIAEDYSQSLYEILAKIGIRLKEADQSIEASRSTNEEIRLLGLNTFFPTLVIKRLARSVSGDPVEYVKGVYHGDRYRYTLKLNRYL